MTLEWSKNEQGFYEATGQHYYFQVHRGEKFWKLYRRIGSNNPLVLIGTWPTRRQCFDQANALEAAL